MTRDEIIKGLECLTLIDSAIYKAECEKRQCPYRGLDCEIAVMVDALDVLKAQEPRVMTISEVRALPDGYAVWLEDNDKPDVIPAFVNHVWNSLPNLVSFTVVHMREVKGDMLWYANRWRCWTSRPTDEQREAVKWE